MCASLPAAGLRGFLFAGRWLLVVAVLSGVVAPALALIEGGEGNEAIRDPGWPAGAAAVFNFKGRVAHWVGPPFGGGEWHAECRGNAEDLNAILAAFDRIDAKNKKVIVHDGTGNSVWLNINREPAKREAAKIDWAFTVWQKENFDRLAKMPPDLRRISESDLRLGPPTTLDIYTGGSVKWADVLMPKGLTVIDKRLEAHGFKLSDGVVLEGKFVDLDLKKPVNGKLRLELVEPQKTGGYKYSVVKEVGSDKNGRWVLKNAPEGWLRLVAVADGYVSRVIGYEKFDGEPRWASYDCGLLCPAPVTGRVVDADGKPLSGVDVQFGDVAAKQIGRYESLKNDESVTTDKDGRFRTESLPAGTASIWVRKPGYVRPGLGKKITMPAKNVELEMMKSAKLEVSVDFSATTPPQGYIVKIAPEGGEVVGSWGGSSNLDPANKVEFKDIPPGKYILTGRPNPGADSQETEPLTVDLKGGDDEKVTLKAK